MENEKITAVLNEVMVNKLESIAFDINIGVGFFTT